MEAAATYEIREELSKPLRSSGRAISDLLEPAPADAADPTCTNLIIGAGGGAGAAIG